MKAQFKNVTLIGTSHIAPESVKDVQKIMKSEQPVVVALELDRSRFLALISGKKRKPRLSDIAKMGMRGFLFNMYAAWMERKLGRLVNTSPGDEMKKAIEMAKKAGIEIVLLDQKVNRTLQRLSKAFSGKEKRRLMRELFFSMFKKQKITIDLRKVPHEKVVIQLTEELKEKFPAMYQVLIHERNLYMVKGIKKVMERYPYDPIIVVVGAGHIRGIMELLEK